MALPRVDSAMMAAIPETPASTASQIIMDDRFKRIFTSEPFTFLIGKEEKRIVVHAAAIAEQSEPLNKLINGGMAEAQKGSAALPDVLEDDFVRVCQFSYTGDYSIPPSATTDEQNSIPSCAPAEDPTPSELPSDQSPSSKSKKKKGKRKSLPAVPQEIELTNGDLTQEYFKDRVEAWRNKTQEQQPQSLEFLEHARIYVFADQWAVEPLKLLSMQKLMEHVNAATRDSIFVEEFVELARYTYSNTADNGKDALREFIIEILGNNLEEIGKAGSFPSLLEDGGSFVREFWGVVQKKLF